MTNGTSRGIKILIGFVIFFLVAVLGVLGILFYGAYKDVTAQRAENQAEQLIEEQKEADAAAQAAYEAQITAEYSDYDKILPNTTIGTVEVGGMTYAEATAAVKEAAQAAQIHTVKVILPDRELTFSSELQDLDDDTAEAVNAAYSMGRETGSPVDLYEALQAAENDSRCIDFSTEETVDSDKIADALQDVDDDIHVDMEDGSFDLDRDTMVLSVYTGSPGTYLDTETLLGEIMDEFDSGVYDDITFDYTTEYPERITLDEMYTYVQTDPINAKYNNDTDSVDEGVPGYEADTDLETADAEVAAADYGETLSYTFHEIQPELDKETVEGMLYQDTLASYGSAYTYNNYGRSKNLRLACAAINGTIVEPGETFSFNNTVGERTTAKGYQYAIVYVNGAQVYETGGGICQVASTIYYCSLYAELDILEREPHTYVVSYVPGGMDCAIYWGQLDYKFRNNTDYPIRIDAYLENGRCYIALVGTDVENHIVEMQSIAISSTEYQLYRYVYDSDYNLLKKEDLGISDYQSH